MRFFSSVLAFLLGLAALGFGIGQLTAWAPDEDETAPVTSPEVEEAPLTVIYPEAVENLPEGEEVLEIEAEGEYTMALGRIDDIEAWIDDAAHIRISGYEEHEENGETTREFSVERVDGEEDIPSPGDSDLWVVQETREGATSHTWTTPDDSGEWAVLMFRDGDDAQGAPAAVSAEVSLDEEHDETFGIIMIIVGGVLLLLSIVLFYMALGARRKKSEEAPEETGAESSGAEAREAPSTDAVKADDEAATSDATTGRGPSGLAGSAGAVFGSGPEYGQADEAAESEAGDTAGGTNSGGAGIVGPGRGGAEGDHAEGDHAEGDHAEGDHTEIIDAVDTEDDFGDVSDGEEVVDTPSQDETVRDESAQDEAAEDQAADDEADDVSSEETSSQTQDTDAEETDVTGEAEGPDDSSQGPGKTKNFSVALAAAVVVGLSPTALTADGMQPASPVDEEAVQEEAAEEEAAEEQAAEEEAAEEDATDEDGAEEGGAEDDGAEEPAEELDSPERDGVEDEGYSVLLELQLERIVTDIAAVTQEGDEAADTELLEDRVTGNALADRGHHYANQEFDEDVAPEPIGEEILAAAVTSEREFPRQAVVITQHEDAEIPQLLIIEQNSARENYKLTDAMLMVPGAEFPPVATEDGGVVPLSEDSDDLDFTPEQAMEGFGLFLNNRNNTFGDNIAESPFVESIQDHQDDLVEAIGPHAYMSWSRPITEEGLTTLQLPDGRAVVVGDMEAILQLRPHEEGAGVAFPSGSVLEGLAGTDHLTENVDITWRESVALLVPEAGSDEDIVVLGVDDVEASVEIPEDEPEEGEETADDEE